jgi:hypothetical protein
MVGFGAACMLIRFDFDHTENDHAVCRQRKLQRVAVQVHKLIYAEPALDFLGISKKKNDEVFGDKHAESISRQPRFLQDMFLSSHPYSKF